MTCKKGCVYLVGAGCGRGDLITVRGLSFLRSCTALVYDDLIAPELLLQTPDDCQLFYMGKRRSAHSALQGEICARLIKLAQVGHAVVRLKGGDPFVFGRGGEEVLALRAAGIPCEVVPGISSAIAIPSAAGIPVTHRATSRGFHVITAHTAGTPDGLPPIEPLAALPDTLVFLMGLAQLPRICEQLIQAGKSTTTPAAVVSGGNAPHPAVVRGTLENISERICEAGVYPPAVIVVGETAALDLSATTVRPLDGVRVGITGTSELAEKLSAQLEDKGAAVIPVQRSLVRELPLLLNAERLAAWKDAWFVFTSANGVRIFFRRLIEAKLDFRALAGVHFAVIGSATAAVLRQYGFRYDLCPEKFTTAALAAALLTAAVPGERIVLLRSKLGTPELARALEDRFTIEDVPLYDLADDPRAVELTDHLCASLDYIVFSSRSGVELFFAGHNRLPEGAVCVCIGSVTAEALRERGVADFLTAESISVEGIVQAIEKHHTT